jgi:predicted alpha/beta superfamily hydrolase
MATEILVPQPQTADVAAEPEPRAPIEPREATDLRGHLIESELLGGQRQLVVFVPEGYDEDSERRYPVLYMQDGQNLFDPTTSYVAGKDWQLDVTAQRLIRDGKIQPLIIVGVYHAGEKRIDEYTPTKDAKRNGGKAAIYLQALTEVIKPHIDNEYRTHPCAWNTGLGGSSLGGLFTMYAGLECPEVFGKLAVMSPSAWWDHREIVREVKNLDLKSRQRIWLDIGTKEAAGAVADARALRDALIEDGWTEGSDLSYTEAVGAHHDEAAWAERSAAMLEFLFPVTV